MTQEQLQIAEDYYFSKMTITEIEKKHSTVQSTINKIAHKIDFRALCRPKEYCVLKVEQSDMETVLMILKEYNIPFEMPQDFELIERYESKINN